MGDRGSEYKAVAKDELEALEMTVSGQKDIHHFGNYTRIWNLMFNYNIVYLGKKTRI